MTPPVVVASRNAGKVRELARLLGTAFDLRPLPDGVPLPDETGSTFAQNARLKAETVFAGLGGEVAVLADDSGLEVDALGGRPGVLSARYAGEQATDQENVARLLDELGGAEDRSARFVCALVLVLPDCARPAGAASLVEVRGETSGAIQRGPRGSGGFGYDPVFRPRGWERTLAEAQPEAKDRVSHRGAAVRALLDALASAGISV